MKSMHNQQQTAKTQEQIWLAAPEPQTWKYFSDFSFWVIQTLSQALTLQ